MARCISEIAARHSSLNQDRKPDYGGYEARKTRVRFLSVSNQFVTPFQTGTQTLQLPVSARIIAIFGK